MAKNEKYWFKRRRYGWGWTPATRQGWLLLGFWAAVFIGGSAYLLKDTPEGAVPELSYFIFVFALVFILMYASLNKGPVPKWRWGKKPTDNPDEDY